MDDSDKIVGGMGGKGLLLQKDAIVRAAGIFRC